MAEGAGAADAAAELPAALEKAAAAAAAAPVKEPLEEAPAEGKKEEAEEAKPAAAAAAEEQGASKAAGEDAGASGAPAPASATEPGALVPVAGDEANGPAVVTPDPSNFEMSHPLEHVWTWWYDHKSKPQKQPSTAYEEHLKHVMDISTVEEFWQLFHHIKKPTELQQANYHFFKQGVKPMWEDDANKQGGKWVLTVKVKSQLNQLWLYTCLAMVGEAFSHGDEVVGAVVSLRKSDNRISLWTRHLSNKEETMVVGREFKEALGVRDRICFQAHGESVTRGRSYCGKNAIDVEL